MEEKSLGRQIALRLALGFSCFHRCAYFNLLCITRRSYKSIFFLRLDRKQELLILHFSSSWQKNIARDGWMKETRGAHFRTYGTLERLIKVRKVVHEM
jgi:hypothetical protein